MSILTLIGLGVHWKSDPILHDSVKSSSVVIWPFFEWIKSSLLFPLKLPHIPYNLLRYVDEAVISSILRPSHVRLKRRDKTKLIENKQHLPYSNIAFELEIMFSPWNGHPIWIIWQLSYPDPIHFNHLILFQTDRSWSNKGIKKKGHILGPTFHQGYFYVKLLLLK